MPTQLAYWDGLADRYAAKPIDNPTAYEQTLTRTRSYLKSSDHVRELGCGTGTTALKLADAVASYHGTDLAPRMIEIATEKAWNAGTTNLRFSSAEASERAEPVDVVLAFNLLHLLRDHEALLGQVFDELRPGGFFISKTPCLGEAAGWVKLMIAGMQLIGRAPFISFLARERLERQIRAAGFEIVERGDYPDRRPPAHFIVARKPD